MTSSLRVGSVVHLRKRTGVYVVYEASGSGKYLVHEPGGLFKRVFVITRADILSVVHI